ncbi:hypothetical protein [Bdellovibrio sp. BCCA]|uniref:hypothetical protein n=1 Tax=Bdellovibrio sp. BCCA TaxID=3136281 RepID=UPI0030F367FD
MATKLSGKKKSKSATKRTRQKDAAHPFAEYPGFAEDYDFEAPHRHSGPYLRSVEDNVSHSPRTSQGPRRDRQTGREAPYFTQGRRNSSDHEEMSFGSSERPLRSLRRTKVDTRDRSPRARREPPRH